MIRDYLYDLSNIIHSYNTNESGVYIVLSANDAVIRILENGFRPDLKSRMSKNPTIHTSINRSNIQNKELFSHHIKQYGNGEGVDQVMEKMRNVNTKLKQHIDNIQGNISNRRSIEEKIHDVQEVGEVAVDLIKFIGDLIEKTGDKSLQRIQEQIADMVTILGKYLDQ